MRLEPENILCPAWLLEHPRNLELLVYIIKQLQGMRKMRSLIPATSSSSLCSLLLTYQENFSAFSREKEKSLNRSTMHLCIRLSIASANFLIQFPFQQKTKHLLFECRK